jgi:hypothetical protein
MADDDDAEAVDDLRLKHAQGAAEYRVAAKRYVEMHASFLRALEAADGALQGFEDAHKAFHACVENMFDNPGSGNGPSDAGAPAGERAREHLFRAASVYTLLEDAEQGLSIFGAALSDELRIMTAVELVRRGASKRGAIARVFSKSGEEGKNSAEFKRMARILKREEEERALGAVPPEWVPPSPFRRGLVGWLYGQLDADESSSDYNDYSASDLADDD